MNTASAPADVRGVRTEPPLLDVMVVGGGPAGAAAAIELAREGRKVALIERTTQAHDKVCGEFLSAEAIEDLHTLGVDLSEAVPIDTVRLAGGLGVREMRLPFAALSLTRRALDEALLRCAAETTVLLLRGRCVESLVRHADAWCATAAGPEGSSVLKARQVVLATGKHDLRRLPRPAGKQSDLVAFKMYFRLAPAQAAELACAVELALFDGGYAGLQLVEDQAANLCCVVRKSRLRALQGGWNGLLAEMVCGNRLLRRRLDGAEPLLERPLAVSSIPYGFVRRDALAETLWAVGDQAAVIPSFTGDGMSMALHSGRLAAQRMIAGEDATAYQRLFHKQVWRQVGVATLLSRGLVSQPKLLECAARLWPGALRAVAAGTRVREEHRAMPAKKEDCCVSA